MPASSWSGNKRASNGVRLWMNNISN